MEITKAYLAKQVDEITLQQADVVLILEQEDGAHIFLTSQIAEQNVILPQNTEDPFLQYVTCYDAILGTTKPIFK